MTEIHKKYKHYKIMRIKNHHSKKGEQIKHCILSRDMNADYRGISQEERCKDRSLLLQALKTNTVLT